MSKIAKNDVTGDKIKTGYNNDTYRDNWDRIFKIDKTEIEEEPWYVVEYNAWVDPSKIFEKALNQNDLEAQAWILEATGLDEMSLFYGRRDFETKVD